MEPTHDPTALPGSPSVGELVVQNGRLAGSRRPLGAALTFLGKAAGCDVRLNVDGVHPLHCLIAHCPEGILVRDLESEGGTFVNGERITTRPLCDGDLLAVGPFQFRVQLSLPSASPEVLTREKDALRIQAAAVAAQQAALTEEEARLAQRRTSLEQQEGQLAAHLEEKRLRLMQVVEHAQNARAALQKERADYHQHIKRVTSDLGQAQRELLEAQQKAQTERQRLIKLRRRLKQRWHRHWTAERQVLSQHEEALAAERRRLEKENERLQQAKDAQVQARLRFNGEMELGKRQLEAERADLRQEQAQWREQVRNYEAELAEREGVLTRRTAALADGERLLEDEKYRWEKGLGLLKRETEGLEARIHNQRRKIVEQRQEINVLEARLRGLQTEAEASGFPAAPGEAPSVLPVENSILPATAEGPCPTAAGAEGEPARPEDAAVPPVPEATPAPAPEPQPTPLVIVLQPMPPSLPVPAAMPEPPANPEADAHAEREARLGQAAVSLQRRVALLERLVEELADQRVLLAEQWERLAWMHLDWHQDRQIALAELEALVTRLPAREEALIAREEMLERAEQSLRRRYQEAVQFRHTLEGWKARLQIREAAWQSERDRALASVRAREELADKQLAAMAEVRQRWTKRRRQELDVFRAERAACEKLRQECTALRQELWRRGNALEEERRTLAEKTLALEQYRQQYVVKAADAASAERRVERLRRRWVTQNANLVRITVAERQALQQEVARLEERQMTLDKTMESLTVREASLAQRQTAWEEAQAQAEAQQAKLRQELQSMQAQRDRFALHLMELQDEVERIARILLEEPEIPLTSSSQAA